MLSLRDFTKEISTVRAALSQAARHAQSLGYSQVDFNPLVSRLKALDSALQIRNTAAVTQAMSQINGSRPLSVDDTSNANVVRVVEASVAKVAEASNVAKRTREEVAIARSKAGMKGGRVRSPAKSREARKNGALGGRPRKLLGN